MAPIRVFRRISLLTLLVVAAVLAVGISGDSGTTLETTGGEVDFEATATTGSGQPAPVDRSDQGILVVDGDGDGDGERPDDSSESVPDTMIGESQAVTATDDGSDSTDDKATEDESADGDPAGMDDRADGDTAADGDDVDGSPASTSGTTDGGSNGSGKTTVGPKSTTTSTSRPTTTTKPTTTRPTTTTSPSSPPPPGGGEGDIKVYANAKQELNQWTSGGNWSSLRNSWDMALVYEPYWDSRLSQFDDVLAYIDLYAIYTDTGRDRRSIDHPEWVLKTAGGSPVYIPFDCNPNCPQYAADISNPAFRRDFIDRLKDLDARGYPAVLLDDVNMAWRFGTRTGGDTKPIDPNTGAELTLDAWQRYVADFVTQIQRDVPGLRIAHNPIWYVDSPDFNDPEITRQLDNADLVQLERGATDAGLVAGTGRYGLQTFIRYIERVHRLGANVILLDETARSEREQWFNLAVGLLANNGGDYVGTEDLGYIRPDRLWSGFSTNLGRAEGRWRVDNGLLRRDFSHGTVYVNEPGRGSKTVSLSGPATVNGRQGVSSFTLQGREAAVVYTG